MPTRIRDPLYRDILAGLGRDLDPTIFELCAVDLVRSAYPAASPVSGGSDGGMDGAIPDPEIGELFSIVCTVSPRPADMSANLQGSLRSYVQNGGKSRRAVFCTPRSATPNTRKKLRDTARNEGFALENVYAQDWFASRLLEHPFWRQELLGLSGRPAVLSKTPLGYRPSPSDLLVGRGAALEQLRQTSGDMAVVGQPGSGKTRLLMELTKSAGLFLTCAKDWARLADEIREKQPAIIIVDDAILIAEFGTGMLEQLRHLREESGADFRIVASSWPGARDLVQVALRLRGDQVVILERLSRDEIVEVIREAGIEAPTALIHLIVDQAEGRPGLAALLAQLARDRRFEDVVTGEALAIDLYPRIGQLIGDKAKLILAVLALGGDTGFDGETAAGLLGMSLVDLWDCLAKLDASGVIREARPSHRSVTPGRPSYIVTPESLRYPLIRDVFFRGPQVLLWSNVVERAASRDDATIALIGAYALGADIPDLLERVAKTVGPRALAAYIAIGSEEARLALSRFPALPDEARRSTLRSAPDAAIPIMLKRAEEDSEAAKRVLEDLKSWIQDLHHGRHGQVERRRLVVDAVLAHQRRFGRTLPSTEAAFLAFRLEVEGYELDPGKGRTITWRHGILGADDIEAVAQMWSRFWSHLREGRDIPWPKMFELLHHWRAPWYLGEEAPRSREVRRRFVRDVVSELAGLSAGRPGVRRRLNELACRVDLDLALDVDQDFESLFPSRDVETDFETWERRSETSVREFVDRHRNDGPAVLAARLMELEGEAKLAGDQSSSLIRYVAHALAEQSEQVLEWIDKVLSREGSWEILLPFFRESVRRRLDGWKERADRLLALQQYAPHAAILLVTFSDIPQELLGRALVIAAKHPPLVEHVVGYCDEVPVEALRQMLTHESSELVKAAVGGHWIARERQREIAAEIAEIWPKAVLRTTSGKWMIEILKSNRELAVEWIQHRCSADGYIPYESLQVLEEVAPGLPADERRALIVSLPVSESSKQVFPRLVAGDADLYGAMLAREDLRSIHLRALAGRPRGRWSDMALLALEAGHAPRDIAMAATDTMHSYSGSEAAYWRGWEADFDGLAEHEDERLRAVARYGQEYVARRARYAEQVERHEAIYGER